jgi:hypothetical protein
MKRWFCLLLLCWGVVCLLLIIDPPTGVHPGQQAGWGGSVDGGRESVPSPIEALLTTSLEFIRRRTGPLESFATRRVLLTAVDDVGPPWLDQRGPPGACGKPWVSCKPAGQASRQTDRAEHTPFGKFPPVNRPSQDAGFFNSL